jgi:nucleoside-diphosphate-sugar epimerase
MSRILIVGRRSNLSAELARSLGDEANLVASADIGLLGDMLDPARPVDIVYNAFVKSTQLRSLDDPEAYSRDTFERLAQFVAICRANLAGVRSVIYTSSSSVYGDNSLASELDHCEIRGLYPAVKLASEFFIRDHLRETPIRVIVPRVFNMFGGQDEFSIVAKVARALMSDAEISIANDGAAIRDFIAIEDVAAAYVALIRSDFEGLINLGTGRGMSVRRVIESAEAAFGRRLRIQSVKTSEIRVSIAAVERLAALLPGHDFGSVDQYYESLAGKA